jgi:hypothetical protein
MKTQKWKLLPSKWQLVVLFYLMTLSVGFSQVGSVTIVGNQDVCGASTWTYSIIGASCSTANWIVSGGTVTSSNNISCTVQWSNSGGTGNVQVSAYGCSPIPDSKVGSLSVTKTIGVQEIGATSPTSNTMNLTAIGSNASSFSWSFSGFTGLTITSQSGNTISISFTSRSSQVSVCVTTLSLNCGKSAGSSETCTNDL